MILMAKVNILCRMNCKTNVKNGINIALFRREPQKMRFMAK